jgi:hypothetical protein
MILIGATPRSMTGEASVIHPQKGGRRSQTRVGFSRRMINDHKLVDLKRAILGWDESTQQLTLIFTNKIVYEGAATYSIITDNHGGRCLMISYSKVSFIPAGAYLLIAVEIFGEDCLLTCRSSS